MTALPTRALVVTKFLPVPPDSGGKLRAWALLRRLADRATVTLAGYDDGDADHGALADLGVRVVSRPWPPSKSKALAGLPRARSVTSARYWDPGLVADLREAASETPPDVVVVEYAQLLAWVAGIDAPRTIWASHNVESGLVASWGRTRRFPANLAIALESKAVRRLERNLLRTADTVSVVSANDRDRLPGPTRRVVVCPNGVDPAPALPPSEEPLAVFVAQLGWRPNADAATWLTTEVWPRVRERRPGARLALVGRDPTPEVRALAAPDIEVTGSVPAVRPWLARAAVALAPLRAAGGSRLKILEALDAGRPVVATTLGAEGLEDLVGDGVVVADEPGALATQITRLLDDPADAARRGAAGHAAVAERYGWDVTLAPLLDAVAPGGVHADAS